MKNFFFLTLITAAILLSCSKDDDTQPINNEPTVTELITSGRWYLEAASHREQTPCSKTSFFRFYEDGEMLFPVSTYSPTPDVCEVETTTTTWVLENNIVMIADGSSSISAEITFISEDFLILKISSEITILLDKVEG